MGEIHAGMLGSFPVVAEVAYPAPRRILPNKFTRNERALFRGVLSRFMGQPPEALRVAIEAQRPDLLIPELKKVLDDPDFPMSNRMRRRCHTWINHVRGNAA